MGTAIAAVFVFANTFVGLTILHRRLQQVRVQGSLFIQWWEFYSTLGAVSGVLNLFLIGPYTLWFWLREMYRVPRYLQVWERNHNGTALLDTQDVDLPSLVARPKGHLILPMGLLLFISLTSGFGSSFNFHVISPMVYTIGLGTLLYVGYDTMTVEGEDVRSVDDEGQVILSALILQFVAFFTWASVGSISLKFAVVIVCLLVPVLVIGFYFPEISLRARDSQSKHVIWAGVFIILIILTSLEALLVSPIAWFLVILGFVGLLLVVLYWMIEEGTV